MLVKRGIVHAILVMDRLNWLWFVHIALSVLLVVCPHQLWLVHIAHSLRSWDVCIAHANFVMVRAHQSGDIYYSLRTSTKLHRSMKCYRNKGLHVSILACVHRLDEMFVSSMHCPGDVWQWRAASTKMLTHWTWFFHTWKEISYNDNQNHPRICIHKSWIVCIVFETLNIARGKQKTFKQNQVLPAPIDFGLHNNKPTSGDSYPHHNLPAKQSFNVERSLPTFPLAWIQRSTNVKCGIPAFYLACKQLLGNIRRCFHSSPLPSTTVN